jgi:hypothetical protein
MSLELVPYVNESDLIRYIESAIVKVSENQLHAELLALASPYSPPESPKTVPAVSKTKALVKEEARLFRLVLKHTQPNPITVKMFVATLGLATHRSSSNI